MRLIAILACATLALPLAARAEASEAEREARLAALTLRLERAEAVKAVERLQYAYGYYQDRFLFDQIPVLFADRGAEVHWEGGVWNGQAGARRLWEGHFRKTMAGGAKGPVAGRMWDMPQWQGVVTVAPDGQSAKGRFRSLGKAAVYRKAELWISGVYEDEFVKEGGVWKISRMRFCSPWQAIYTEGWQDAKAADFAPKWTLAPRDQNGPDRLATPAERCTDQWPDAGLVPFSFENPVTAKPAPAAPAPTPKIDIALATQRAGQLSDAYELERFHHAYGWQQDYMLFNPQVDLFMDGPGSFTRYKLGYYAGKDGARRVWPNRFGSFTNFADMPVYGSMIDHHQAQGIITVAPDRQSAKARFRTSADHFFSDFGSRLSSRGLSSGGADQSVIYENEYARENGMWKIKSVLVCIYGEGALGSGYADLPVPGRLGVPADAKPDYWIGQARTKDDPGNWNDPPPGNPAGPDRAETPERAGCFFAKNHTMIHSALVPFHFPNPVTGKPVIWVNK